jgi:hypothetical protein
MNNKVLCKARKFRFARVTYIFSTIYSSEQTNGRQVSYPYAMNESPSRIGRTVVA